MSGNATVGGRTTKCRCSADPMNNEGASVCSAAVGLWLDEAGQSIDAVVSLSLTRWHSHRLNFRQQCTIACAALRCHIVCVPAACVVTAHFTHEGVQTTWQGSTPCAESTLPTSVGHSHSRPTSACLQLQLQLHSVVWQASSSGPTCLNPRAHPLSVGLCVAVFVSGLQDARMKAGHIRKLVGKHGTPVSVTMGNERCTVNFATEKEAGAVVAGLHGKVCAAAPPRPRCPAVCECGAGVVVHDMVQCPSRGCVHDGHRANAVWAWPHCRYASGRSSG